MAKKRKARTNKKKHFASMKHFTVISVFDDLDQAQKAMEGLLRAGIHPNQIWYTMRGGDTSMLNALAHLDAPDEEGDFYFRAFEADHTVVMVQTTDREQEVSALLRREGGYDFNTRAPQTGDPASIASPDSAGESGRTLPRAGWVTVGLQPAARSSLSWYRSWKLDHVLLALSAAQLALYGLLTWRIRTHPVFPIDEKITRTLQKLTSPVWQHLASAVSYLGGSPAIANTLAFPVAAALWKRRLRLEAVMTLGVPFTSLLAGTVMKRLVNRPRPGRMQVHVYERKHTRSFPSGDVTSSVTFWGWLFVLGMLLTQGKGLRQRALVAPPVLFVALSGPARVYLGVHWASDVLGAYLFGGSWLSMSLRLYRALKKRKVLA
jgi:membrane-associated phospholipid phosphatase